jgi:hypothetical protein
MREHVRRVVVAVAVVALLTAACGGGTDGLGDQPAAVVESWRLVSLDVAGQPVQIARPLFLDVTEDGFRAATTCNSVSGQYGGELMTTAMLCLGTANDVERFMVQALRIEPSRDDNTLVFDDGEVRLVYEAFTDPGPTDLFAVLGDSEANVDESMLPSEQATGTVAPDFETLVPLASPSAEVDLFLAQFDDQVCLVYGTARAMDKYCAEPRLAAEVSRAIDIPIYGPPSLRVALIPDAFGSAVSELTSLGSYSANVLIVRADAPEGTVLLTDDQGNTLQLVIPPPWTDRINASSTLPAP